MTDDFPIHATITFPDSPPEQPLAKGAPASELTAREHAKDFMLVAEATERAIDVLGGDSERDMIDVSVSGSISQTQETPDSRIVCGVSVKIYVTSTPTPVVPPLPELIEQSR